MKLKSSYMACEKREALGRSKFNFAHRVPQARSNKTSNRAMRRLSLPAYDGGRCIELRKPGLHQCLEHKMLCAPLWGRNTVSSTSRLEHFTRRRE